VAVCWIGGLAIKGILNLAIQRISKILKYGTILSALFSLSVVAVSQGIWFIPKLSGVKYTEDINWSTLYLIATGIDFAILQQINGFIQYMATLRYLSAPKNLAFIYRYFKRDYFLNK